MLANFQISYTKYFNTKNDRVGSLFQGQFKAVKIDSEEQLLHVSRYIHLNPYSSAVVSKVEELMNYKWSSLPEYQNIGKFAICSKELIFNSFKTIDSYMSFIFDNADYQKNLENIRHLVFDR